MSDISKHSTFSNVAGDWKKTFRYKAKLDGSLFCVASWENGKPVRNLLSGYLLNGREVGGGGAGVVVCF